MMMMMMMMVMIVMVTMMDDDDDDDGNDSDGDNDDSDDDDDDDDGWSYATCCSIPAESAVHTLMGIHDRQAQQYTYQFNTFLNSISI